MRHSPPWYVIASARLATGSRSLLRQIRFPTDCRTKAVAMHRRLLSSFWLRATVLTTRPSLPRSKSLHWREWRHRRQTVTRSFGSSPVMPSSRQRWAKPRVSLVARYGVSHACSPTRCRGSRCAWSICLQPWRRMIVPVKSPPNCRPPALRRRLSGHQKGGMCYGCAAVFHRDWPILPTS